MNLSELTTTCACHPEATSCHELMQDEMRCVYCGERIAPVNCNGCGRYLSLAELQEGMRCDDCA